MEAPKKILIVEDDFYHRKMLEILFTTEGYKVYQADDGETAIDLVGEQLFDLIIMDLRMKRVGGLEALTRIKTIRPEIPVVLMSAQISTSIAAYAYNFGAFSCLSKPLDTEKLKMLVLKILYDNQHEDSA